MPSQNKFSHLQNPIRSRQIYVNPKTGKPLPRQVIAGDLCPHPDNPKVHPEQQHLAVAGSLDTLGQIDPIKININNGYIIDGHERAWLAMGYDENMLVDVLWYDLTDSEHELALTVFDPVGDLAYADREKLEVLLHRVNTDNEALQTMLAGMAEAQGITPPDFQPVDMSELPRLDQLEPKWVICPHCGEKFDARLASDD